jgi:chromosome segregation ATPase
VEDIVKRPIDPETNVPVKPSAPHVEVASAVRTLQGALDGVSEHFESIAKVHAEHEEAVAQLKATKEELKAAKDEAATAKDAVASAKRDAAAKVAVEEQAKAQELKALSDQVEAKKKEHAELVAKTSSARIAHDQVQASLESLRKKLL